MKSLTLLLALFISICHSVAQQPKLIVPIGHTANISYANFTRDSKYFVTISEDKTSKVWEVLSGKLLHSFAIEDFSLSSTTVRFSHNGTLMATSRDSTVKIWNVLTGNLYKLLKLGEKIDKIDFSDDDKNIVVISTGIFRLYEIATLRSVYKLSGTFKTFSHNGKYILYTVYNSRGDSDTANILYSSTGKLFKQFALKKYAMDISFSSDDNYILVDHLINLKDYPKVYETASGKLLYGLPAFNDWERPAIFSPRVHYILTVHGSIKIWDATNGKFLDSIKGAGRFRSATFSTDEKVIVSESDDARVKTWDVLNGKFVCELPDENKSGSYDKINFSSDNKYVVGENYRGIKIWDVASCHLVYNSEDEQPGPEGNFRGLAAYSSNGRYLAVINHNKGKIWDIKPHNFIKLQAVANVPYTSAISPDGRYIATIYTDSSANVRELLTGKILYNIKDKGVASTKFSINGELVTISGTNRTVKVWNASDSKLLHTLKDEAVFNSANFDFGGSKIVTAEDEKIKIWRTQTGELINVISTENIKGQLASFTSNGELILSSNGTLWDTKTGTQLRRIPNHTDFNAHGFHSLQSWNFFLNGNVYCSPDGNYIAALHSHPGSYGGSVEGIGIVNISTGEIKYLPVEYSWNTNNALDIKFSLDGKHISAACSNGMVNTWDLFTGKRVALDLNYSFTDAVFTPDQNYIVTISPDFTSKIWEASTGKLLCTFIAVDSTDYLNQIPSGYYMSSLNAAKLLHYVTKDLKVITFQQLDLKYNRPDKVLEAMDCPDTALINSYRNLYLKRIKKFNIDTTAFRESYSVPEADFTNRDSIDTYQTRETFPLHIHGMDSTYGLDRFNVWINEVPLFGVRGINLRARNRKSFDTTFAIALSQGPNQIETSITNVNGTESYRAPLEVNYTAPQPLKEKLYFIGIGIDHFKDSRYDLNWSEKDVRDLAQSFQTKYGADCLVTTLYDEEVSTENIKALKQVLRKTSKNDKVIVAYSGHGLLSKAYDYFLSTYGVNFQEPEKEGLPYEALEDLLDSIPARKKLLLVDACHSGEVDKEEMAQYRQVQGKLDSIGVSKGTITENKDSSKTGLKNGFALMQQVFVNVGRSTGATVISAAAGTEFALERGDLKNGVFTYSILEMMKQSKTVAVSELKRYVNQKVTELTHGMQQPTSRNENNVIDWIVW